MASSSTGGPSPMQDAPVEQVREAPNPEQGGWCCQQSSKKPDKKLTSRQLERIAAIAEKPPAPGQLSCAGESIEPSRSGVMSRDALRRLKERLTAAQSRAASESALPVMHGSLCAIGLTLVQLLRLAAWFRGEYPPESVLVLHALSMWSDVTGILCTLPVLLAGAKGRCVRNGCIGPIMTLVLAMALMDIMITASIFWLRPVILHPPNEGLEATKVLQNTLTSWNCAVIASSAFQVSLCACFWRVYRTLRISGLYPPDNHEKLLRGEVPKEISPFEICCESEEVQLLQECQARDCTPCMTRSREKDKVELGPAPISEVRSEPQDLDIQSFTPEGALYKELPLSSRIPLKEGGDWRIST